MSKLSGMTGFARHTSEVGGARLSWEAKSVNGKGLDIRLRLPSEFSEAEIPVRKAISGHLHRGNVQVNLLVERGGDGTDYEINEALFDKLLAFFKARRVKPKYSHIIQVRGVVTEAASRLSDEERTALIAHMIAEADRLGAKLKSARDAEGSALAPVMADIVGRIEQLTDDAEKQAAGQAAAVKDKLTARLSDLQADNLPEDRMAAEIAVLAQKADVREETDRLRAHCQQARDLLAAGSPVGRKLDFLAQEFNREANTLCSKSSDIDLTRTGMALKGAIEQFREQAANVE